MTDYFPTRHQMLRDRYNDRMNSIRRASIAAMETQTEDRMDDVYRTVRGALISGSLGDLGDNERRVREHLADQLETICISWQQSGEVLHDVAGALSFDDFLSDDAPFADLSDDQAFPGLTYIHFGKLRGLATSKIPICFVDGFFTQPSSLAEQDGNMLTFTCGFQEDENGPSELGPLLRLSSRVVQAWIPSEDDNREPMLFGDPDLIHDPAIHHALVAAAASVRIVAKQMRSAAYR